MNTREEPFWNPYVAGVALGGVLLASFAITGLGLGASGAANRLAVAGLGAVAPSVVDGNPSMSSLGGGHPVLDSRLVLMALGVLLGALLSAYASGRLEFEVLRGPRAAPLARLVLALSGGVLMGMAARLARGCTSGQALSGGALLSAGSWLFMMAVFAGGYATAWFVRRQWT